MNTSVRRSGFSMIELVFVIVILGVLAAVAVPRFVATRTDAQVATARSDMASAQKAIVAKVFADNIDPTQSSAPDPNQAVKNQTNFTMTWSQWIMEVAGLDGSRWSQGGGNVISVTSTDSKKVTAQGKDSIQPIGNVKKSTGGVGKGGCKPILGISHDGDGGGNYKGSLLFAPATLDESLGDFCRMLKESYANSGGDGNKIIPLASSGTVEF